MHTYHWLFTVCGKWFTAHNGVGGIAGRAGYYLTGIAFIWCSQFTCGRGQRRYNAGVKDSAGQIIQEAGETETRQRGRWLHQEQSLQNAQGVSIPWIVAYM